MDGLSFLGAAFVIVWLGIVLFLLAVARRQKALEKRMEELRQNVEGAAVK